MLTKAAPLYLTAVHGFEALRPAVRRGGLERFRRGAYIPPPNPGAPWWEVAEQRLMARCLAVARTMTTPFAFSFETAGFLHEWPGPRADLVHVTQTFRPRAGLPDDVVRHYRPDLAPEEIVHIGGLPVLAPARTAVDCALGYPPSIALPFVDAAIRQLAAVDRFERAASQEREALVREELAERLRERGPARHVRRARAVIEHASGFAESGPESWVRWVALSRGLPLPELQLPVETVRGTLYPDLMWPDFGPVMSEYDGMDKYDDDGEAVVAQTEREQLLTDTVGGRVVRFTKHTRRDDPEGALRRLLGAFDRRPALTPRLDLLDRRVRI